jgi:replicative DNA helicase
VHECAVASLYISLEMTGEQIVDRVAASRGGVPAIDMARAHIRRDQWPRLTEAMQDASKLPIWIVDRSDVGLLDIWGAIRDVKRQCAQLRAPGDRPVVLGYVYVDYLQLMAPPKDRDMGGRAQEVAYIARGLKNLAKAERVVMIALSQLVKDSRQAVAYDDDAAPPPPRRMTVHMLKESSEVAQAADNIWFILRTGELFGGGLEGALVLLEKTRQGPRGKVMMLFDGVRMTSVERPGASIVMAGPPAEAPATTARRGGGATRPAGSGAPKRPLMGWGPPEAP